MNPEKISYILSSEILQQSLHVFSCHEFAIQIHIHSGLTRLGKWSKDIQCNNMYIFKMV